MDNNFNEQKEIFGNEKDVKKAKSTKQMKEKLSTVFVLILDQEIYSIFKMDIFIVFHSTIRNI